MSENPKAPATAPLPVLAPESKSLEQIIQEKAPDVLKELPQDKRQTLASVRIEKHEISFRAGILPDPSELDAYNKIIPDGADRILKMAEAQSAHRIAIEKKVVGSQQGQAFCGQLFGLIIGLSGLGCATFAAISGQPVFGGVIGGVTLVSLVSAFLYTRHSSKREMGRKQQQMQEIQRHLEHQPQGPRKKKYRNR